MRPLSTNHSIYGSGRVSPPYWWFYTLRFLFHQRSLGFDCLFSHFRSAVLSVCLIFDTAITYTAWLFIAVILQVCLKSKIYTKRGILFVITTKQLPLRSTSSTSSILAIFSDHFPNATIHAACRTKLDVTSCAESTCIVLYCFGPCILC